MGCLTLSGSREMVPIGDNLSLVDSSSSGEVLRSRLLIRRLECNRLKAGTTPGESKTSVKLGENLWLKQ